MNHNPVKRLYVDIETSPDVVLSWRIGYDVKLDHDNIIKERQIICICWKWEGEDEVYSLDWGTAQDDYQMVKKFTEIANEADEICGHYIDRFDLPWIRTRCLIHGFDPLPPYKTIDTKQWASKYYYFNSNKLDYLGQVLGFGKKIKTDYDLWKGILLENDQKKLRQMVTYCKRDIELLEKVWSKLRYCVKPKTHTGVVAGNEQWSCPHCGSVHVKKSKTRVAWSGVINHQMKCEACHGYYQISDRNFRAHQEAKKKVGG